VGRQGIPGRGSWVSDVDREAQARISVEGAQGRRVIKRTQIHIILETA
jgi:hypothetical protein